VPAERAVLAFSAGGPLIPPSDSGPMLGRGS
jgi:hypothetical protein